MTVGVMAVGTVPDTAGVERPAAGIYAKSSSTKPKEKSENIVKGKCKKMLIKLAVCIFNFKTKKC